LAGGLCSLSLSVRAEGRVEGRVCSVTMQWSGSPLLLLLLLLTLVRGDNYFLLETYKDSADTQSGIVHTATTHKCRHGPSELSVKSSKK
jgi:hypothetical protein